MNGFAITTKKIIKLNTLFIDGLMVKFSFGWSPIRKVKNWKGIEAMQIGGKTKVLKPTQPQFVVQIAKGHNEYMKLDFDGVDINVLWVGDPNAATKFDSKYSAKSRVRDIDNIPGTRCFKALDNG